MVLCMTVYWEIYIVELGYNVMKGTEYFVDINECCYN
jgi:hypothetical protein